MSPLQFRLRGVAIIAAIFSGMGLCSAAQITSNSFLVTWLGSTAQYQITADNNPTSFDATNLPPGLTLNRSTGLVSGVPTISGVHDAEVVAHGQGEARATVSFIVYVPVPANDPVSGGLGVQCISMLADPNRPRIYCGGSNQELVVIATDTMSIIKRIPNTGYIEDLNISPDGRTLWCVRTYYYNSVARLNLDRLDGLTVFPTEKPVDSVREGLDNRLYAATRGVEVLQLDATTGVVQLRFQPSGDHQYSPGLKMELSPDRRTLYLSDAYYDPGNTFITYAELSRYDVATGTPAFLQRVEVPAPRIYGITVAPDSASLYLILADHDGYGSRETHQTLCLSAADLTTKGALSFRGTPIGPVTITADSARALQVAALGDGGELTTGLVNIFDTQSFQLLRTIVVGTDSGTLYLSDAALNQAGSSLFLATDLNPALRVYDMASPPPPMTPAKSLLNISTRMLTQTGDNVVIGGFIVKGMDTNQGTPRATDSKRVIVRAIGPSLPLVGRLADPVLELHGPDGAIIAANDNWNAHRADVIATGLPPPEEYEAAIVAILSPGAYTAILRGSAGTNGIAVVEAYDLNASASLRLANISTRGKVETGDNVMIGGWIIGGGESTNVAIRAIGPSLTASGVGNALADPTLAVYNASGALIDQNDDWRTNQERLLMAAGMAPQDNRESAVLLSLLPGNYTAIVRGKNDTTGVALVEAYRLDN
jgi:hypothetical protein